MRRATDSSPLWTFSNRLIRELTCELYSRTAISLLRRSPQIRPRPPLTTMGSEFEETANGTPRSGDIVLSMNSALVGASACVHHTPTRLLGRVWAAPDP
jgi:hypothetical protein